MLKTKRKNIELAVLFGLICAMVMSLSSFDAGCDSLRSGVLRLHIIANSDSVEDQKIKLAVRDRVLELTGNVFDGASDLEQAVICAEQEMEHIERIANEVLCDSGFSYTASAHIGDSYFETRHYETFTLPAGTYRSLIIELGEGKGKNWWCVVFPGMCLPAAKSGDLESATNRKGAEIAENPDRYIVKFKAVEIYEEIKRRLDSRQPKR